MVQRELRDSSLFLESLYASRLFRLIDHGFQATYIIIMVHIVDWLQMSMTKLTQGGFLLHKTSECTFISNVSKTHYFGTVVLDCREVILIKSRYTGTKQKLLCIEKCSHV